jgi:hypothetical protein
MPTSKPLQARRAQLTEEAGGVEPEFEVVSFRIEKPLRVKLDELIVLTGLSQSEVIRRLILHASAQAPKLQTSLDKVVSRQRDSKAGARKVAVNGTREAFGNGNGNGNDGQ